MGTWPWTREERERGGQARRMGIVQGLIDRLLITSDAVFDLFAPNREGCAIHASGLRDFLAPRSSPVLTAPPSLRRTGLVC